MSKWFVLLLVMFTVNAEEVNVNPIKGFVSEKVIVRSESGAFIKFMPVNELPVIEEIKLVGEDDYGSLKLELASGNLLIDASSIELDETYDMPELTSLCVNKAKDYVAETVRGSGGCD